MPMTSAKFVPYETKTSLIKIYAYEEQNPVGVLINPYFEEDQVFHSLTQLVFIVENLQDELSFPQKTMTCRSFKSSHGSGQAMVSAKAGTETKKQVIAKFKLSILFRQNASWQGSILWVEKSLQSEFRSVLELITLMDSVLSEQNKNKKGELI